MRDAHSSHPGHDETTGDANARRLVSAARPGEARALSSVGVYGNCDACFRNITDGHGVLLDIERDILGSDEKCLVLVCQKCQDTHNWPVYQGED